MSGFKNKGSTLFRVTEGRIVGNFVVCVDIMRNRVITFHGFYGERTESAYQAVIAFI